jgi:hypothetical protein
MLKGYGSFLNLDFVFNLCRYAQEFLKPYIKPYASGVATYDKGVSKVGRYKLNLSLKAPIVSGLIE